LSGQENSENGPTFCTDAKLLAAPPICIYVYVIRKIHVGISSALVHNFRPATDRARPAAPRMRADAQLWLSLLLGLAGRRRDRCHRPAWAGATAAHCRCRSWS